MSVQKFQEAKRTLAHSQHMADMLQQSQMDQQDPAMEQPVEETPQEQPVEAPVAPQETPQEPTEQVPETTEPEEKVTTNEAVKEISESAETGFDALIKAAEALKEGAKKKTTKVGKRLRDRLFGKKD